MKLYYYHQRLINYYIWRQYLYDDSLKQITQLRISAKVAVMDIFESLTDYSVIKTDPNTVTG